MPRFTVRSLLLATGSLAAFLAEIYAIDRDDPLSVLVVTTIASGAMLCYMTNRSHKN